VIRKRKEIVGGVRWSQICACGVTGLRIILVLGLCWLCLLGWLGAPGLRGLCRRPRKQPLLWLSWHSREPFLKKLHNPILWFPLSLSLSYSDSFASVAVKDSLSYPHKHISFPLFEILLFFLGDQELGCIQKFWSPHLGVFLSISGEISSIVEFMNVHWGCVVVSSTNRLSVGEGWFEGIRAETDLFAFKDEVHETWIEAGFLSDWREQCQVRSFTVFFFFFFFFLDRVLSLLFWSTV
jgi:hypothetical protein